MRLTTFCLRSAFGLLILSSAVDAAVAQPQPQRGDYVIKNFRFHTGEVLPELNLHYVTFGAPTGQPVLVLHGSSGSSGTMMGKNFAGELFGPGQPLDASKYFLILTDSIGAGRSSKPSNALRMNFPKYDYDDMVVAQHRLLTEHLGIRRLKLVIGQSMGGMHSWMWGYKYPDFMETLVPMGSQPTALAGRNWVLRRMMIDLIKADPAYNNGNYTEQPASLKLIAAYSSLCDQQRHAGIASPGAQSSAGRQARAAAAGRALHRRRQRLHLRLRGRAQLRSVTASRKNHRARAGNQRGGRRA